MNGSQDHQVENCISSILPKECSPPEASKVWHTLWEGYLAIIVGVFGVAGNTLSISVLLDGLLLDLFDRMLLCLAICDITFLGKRQKIDISIFISENLTYEQDLCHMQYFFVLVTGLPVSLQKVYLNNDLSTIEKSDTLLDIGRCFTSIARIALNGSAYVTVSMAIERLIGKGYESLRFMIIIF